MSRNNDDLGRGFELANLLQGLKAIDSREPDVQKHDVKRLALDLVESSLSTGSIGYAIAFILKDSAQGVPNGGFVINDQDIRHRWRWAGN
jgi:hypothetical protein